MCTALNWHNFFGRTLDLDRSLGEYVVLTPHSYPITFRAVAPMPTHYAMLGMGLILEGYPLYYDAMNEKGLAMAGLNFPGCARYFPREEGRDNVAPFELIPWVLGQCASLEEVRSLLANLRLLDENFSPNLPSSPLHWIIGDGKHALVLESTETGLRLYEDPYGVLANAPPFDHHLSHLGQFSTLTCQEPNGSLGELTGLKPVSLGLGAVGLPGDLSSMSRFVRCVYTALHARPGEKPEEDLSQFFHILGSVEQTMGCAVSGPGWEQSVYTSGCDLKNLVYYYHTYHNRRLSAVKLQPEGTELKQYPLHKEQDILWIDY